MFRREEHSGRIEEKILGTQEAEGDQVQQGDNGVGIFLQVDSRGTTV